jgi:hypothetical protein
MICIVNGRLTKRQNYGVQQPLKEIVEGSGIIEPEKNPVQHSDKVTEEDRYRSSLITKIKDIKVMDGEGAKPKTKKFISIKI